MKNTTVKETTEFTLVVFNIQYEKNNIYIFLNRIVIEWLFLKRHPL